ncbi:MAG: hypothetical protein AAF066_10225 [Pseudomonadota bacterium]
MSEPNQVSRPELWIGAEEASEPQMQFTRVVQGIAFNDLIKHFRLAARRRGQEVSVEKAQGGVSSSEEIGKRWL